MIGERDTSFKVIRTVLLACAALLCASCMWVPAARDDFSVMGNDVFSNLIREGRCDKGDATKGRGVGFSMLDSEKLSNLSQGLFGEFNHEVQHGLGIHETPGAVF